MRRSRKCVSKGRETRGYIWTHNVEKRKTAGLWKRRRRCLGLGMRGQPLVSATSRRINCWLFCGAFFPSLHHYRRSFLALTPRGSVPTGRSLRRQRSRGLRNASLPRSAEITGWGNETRHNSHASPDHGNYGGINTNIFAVFQWKRCHLMWHRSFSTGKSDLIFG